MRHARPFRPRLYHEVVQEVQRTRDDEDKCPSSADIQANMVVELHELPDSDSDSGSATSSVIASGFMAMELDPGVWASTRQV